MIYLSPAVGLTPGGRSVVLYPKAMVGWDCRMRNVKTEKEVFSTLEHLRIEIQVDSNSRGCVNTF